MTLQVRIIALVVIFAIILIAGFAAIQVVNQLNTLNQHNTYRVRVGASAANTALEFALAVQQAQHPTEDPLPALKAELPRLQAGGLIDSVALLTPEGESLAAEGTVPSTDAQDNRWAPYAATTYSKENWLYTQVTPTAVYAYVPLLINQNPRYVVRFTFGLANIQQAMDAVYQPSILMAIGVILLSGILVWVLIQAIMGPIQTLNQATQDIAAGNLTLTVQVETGDELQELAETFNEMTKALVKMKARAENANPLTKLPGNTVIHEEIDKRIKGNKKFVAVYSDLDNFKAFNDKYGIGAGDQAIKITAKLMKDSLRQGGPGDFLGHEGGDDFVLLTTPEKTPAVTDYVCTEFDTQIRSLYSAEDLARGCIVSKDREGNTKQFPIMTISLAGATNVHRVISSYAEVTNICAEVKKKAKMASKEAGKSTFTMDKRTSDHSAGKSGEPGHAEPAAAPPTAAAPAPAAAPPQPPALPTVAPPTPPPGSAGTSTSPPGSPTPS